MKYHCSYSLQCIISEYSSSRHDIRVHTNYKKIGVTNMLSQLVVTQLWALVGWMTKFFISNNGDSTDSNLSLLTRVEFNHYQINSTLPPYPIAHTPGPASAPSRALFGMSNSQVSLLIFKKGTKRDLTAYPIFKSEKYYDTFCHSFYKTAKAQGLGEIVSSKCHFTLNMEPPLLHYFLIGNSPSCTLF